MGQLEKLLGGVVGNRCLLLLVLAFEMLCVEGHRKFNNLKLFLSLIFTLILSNTLLILLLLQSGCVDVAVHEILRVINLRIHWLERCGLW